jgi:prevent-host-death family protein
MASVGAFDAKTHLSELLERVSRGESITITRHGIPTAMLIPVHPTQRKLSHAQVVEGMREIRKRVLRRARGKKLKVRALVAEGRRY